MVGEKLAPDPLVPVEQPRYVQLARAVRSAIAQGVLPAGDRLPAERELCRRFSVSRATVRRALVELEEQGCVRAAGTRGWFVTALVEPSVLMGFTDLADHRGFATSSRVLACTVRAPNLDEAEVLRAPPGAEVLELERVRLMDGVPLGWQRAAGRSASDRRTASWPLAAVGHCCTGSRHVPAAQRAIRRSRAASALVELARALLRQSLNAASRTERTTSRLSRSRQVIVS